MLTKIHHQTAKRILRDHSYVCNPEYTTQPLSVKEVYNSLKKGDQHLLRTGAVILQNKEGIFLYGYAMDKSDVTSLLR